MDRKNSTIKKVLTIAAAVIIVLGLVILILNLSGRFNVDTITRLIKYISVEKDENGIAEGIEFSNYANDVCAEYDDMFVMASGVGFQLVDKNSEVILSGSVALSKPVVKSSDKSCLVYDAGGTELIVFNEKEIILELDDNKIFTADLNADGWLAVVSEETVYKNVVTIYNDEMDPVYKWYSSSGYVTDACVSPDCKSMWAVSLGTSNEEFLSRIVRYDLDSEEEQGNFALAGSVISNIEFAEKDILWAVAESALISIGTDCEEYGRYSFENMELSKYSLDEDGMAALVLAQQTAGSADKIVTLDSQCGLLGQTDAPQTVLDISVCGKYIGVLYSDALGIYTQRMQQYDFAENTPDVRNIEMHKDGSVGLILSGSVKKYIP